MTSREPPPVHADQKMRVSLRDVSEAIRWLLGRNPINIEEQIFFSRYNSSYEELRNAIMSTDEFRDIQTEIFSSLLRTSSEPMRVEVETSTDDLRRTLERMRPFWSGTGGHSLQSFPRTNEEFNSDRKTDSKERLFAEGHHKAKIIKSILDRLGIPRQNLPRAVEYGCGEGEVTIHLPSLFRRVISCDVSSIKIALAEAECRARDVPRVMFHLSDHESLMPERNWDFWFSDNALYNNPPTVSSHILSLAYRGLVRGGVAIFNVPTFMNDYKFSVSDYISGTIPEDAPIHVLPQKVVFEHAARHRMLIREVWDTPVSAILGREAWRSTLFVFQKAR